MAYNMEEFIEKMVARDKVRSGDTVNEAGILCCGVCGEERRREKYFQNLGKVCLVPRSCACGRARAKEEEERERQALFLRRQRESLMERKYFDATFSNFLENESNSMNLKQCRTYVKHFEEMSRKNRGLMFYGKNGMGKTYMAACISNALMELGESVVMMSLVGLVKRIQTMDFQEEGQRTLERWSRVGLLVLDDFGAERCSEYVLEHVFHIVNSRYQGGKPMIITTNYDVQEFRHVSDVAKGRIYDRILEMCVPVQVLGRSFRVDKAKGQYSEFMDLVNRYE